MTISKRLAGILAILATLTALLITLPFTAAFFRAYEPHKLPEWLFSFIRTFPSLLDFATDTRVYQIYGRIYSLVIPLTLPVLMVLKNQVGTSTRLSLWGWRIFLSGVLMGGLGITGDYWPNPNSILVGIGFALDLLGTLVMWVGAILYGVAAIRGKQVPSWVGFALIGIGPVGILSFALLGHIPSGPWLGYVVFCLVMGCIYLGGVKVIKSTPPGSQK